MQTDLTVIANFEQLRKPAELLKELCSQSGVPAETFSLVELALQELLTNQVEHAYENNSAGTIKLQFNVDADKILIVSEDAGLKATFDLNKVKMPDPLELAEGGYGMAIIKNVMDDVSYRRLDGRNIWKLMKRFKKE